MRFTLEELKKATNAEIKGYVDGDFEISTDTRTIKKGDIYLPLKGENFDGEAFCDKAIDAGAVGCFCTKECPSATLSLKVNDTKIAYLQIANFARRKYSPKVIGVTGSSGKTTTKEMIYSVVSEKFKSHKTFSNHNNEIGFCQTALSMPEDTEVLIVEMGMRGLGEIELIDKFAEPDYAVITNAGSAHIGRLGSLDNIAKAKCEITSHLKEVLIANDNPRLRKFANFDGEKIFYSLNDVKILEKRSGYSKFIYKNKEYELNVEGDYNIENSLTAIEIGYKLGMSYDEIKSGLAKYHPIEKRWEEHKSKYNWERENKKPLYLAFQKYGLENFDYDIIEHSNYFTRDELNQKEIYYIEKYNSYQNGYNMNKGGNYTSGLKKLTDEQAHEIQNILITTRMTFEEISKKYCIQISTISYINNGQF